MLFIYLLIYLLVLSIRLYFFFFFSEIIGMTFSENSFVPKSDLQNAFNVNLSDGKLARVDFFLTCMVLCLHTTIQQNEIYKPRMSRLRRTVWPCSVRLITL